MLKQFVLDTSVLLFDHNAISNFEEHDVIIPIYVLEELDNFKIGNQSTNFEARSVIRFLDNLSEEKDLHEWISLGEDKGRLKVMHCPNVMKGKDAEHIFGPGKMDHKIINVALTQQAEHEDRKVVLVTKDINLRLKAKSLGLASEDYMTGKVDNASEISDTFTSALNNLDASLIERLYEKKHIPEEGILQDFKVANGFYILNNCEQSALARYDVELDEIMLVEKKFAYGIKPRNAEQTFALNALLNERIKLVALQGVAGTGKTLLALAAALEQKNMFDQIILSRPIIPLNNRDIGFLPGTAEDKITPYMQPLWDNLKVIQAQYGDRSRKKKWIEDMLENEQLNITALNFIRGRSLTNVMFIIDEAQNLTPLEIKTIITRAGEGTKIVFCGDIKQIDTPYLDENSNGLSYIIDRLKGSELFAHVNLLKGERSELADLANQLL
ncbi:MAG: PhoH family protein [Saprospiraceae bacterium]|nr:PhoH family protein [Saprospiraceae bacterium]